MKAEAVEVLQGVLRNRVWAVERRAFETFVGLVGRAARGLEAGQGPDSSAGAGRQLSETWEDGTAVIAVRGMLVRSAGAFAKLFGLQGTDEIQQAVAAAAAAADVQRILLWVDSPGGVSTAWPELADEVRRADAVKPVYAYAEATAASAAYAITSQARRVWIGPSADVGSVGTLLVVADWSKFFEEAGVKVHVVASGELKGAGWMGTEVGLAELEYFQQIVDDTHRTFREAVQRGRGLTDEQMTALADGRLYVGERGRQMGLVDGVGLWREAYAALIDEEQSMAETQQAADDGPRVVTLAELKAAYPASTAEWREGVLEAELTAEQAAQRWRAQLEADKAELTGQLGEQTALVKKLEAETARLTAQVEKLTATAAAGGGRAVDYAEDGEPAPATTDEGWQAEFKRDAAIQREFRTVEAYVAFKRQEQAGNVHILRSKAS